MFNKIGIVFVFALIATFTLVSGVGAVVHELKNKEAMLEPGDMTFCDRAFSVENKSTEMAEVGVILGNGANYSFEQVEPGTKKAYTLTPTEENITGWSDKTFIGEARIVNITGGTTPLKITCK